MKATVYHNDKCSKSNTALQLLLQRGIEVEVINYLETPLSREQLQNLLNLLGIEAKTLIRFGEPAAIELGIRFDDIRDNTEWISFMIQAPILIERPIIVINHKAVIGRPIETLLDLIREK
jgi:arsenate reductase (glutaredoxin)